MAGLKQLLRCIGEAVCAHGLEALAGLAPLGGVLYAIAVDARQRLRESHQDEQIRLLLEASAAASPEEARAEADAITRDLAADQPDPVRGRLSAYLAQAPAALRQSLRRPSDPSGRTVPPRFSLQRPEDLLQLLPTGFPRFAVGDRPSGVGDWRLEEMLGMGGFGEVWKARHVFFDGIPPVALKFCLDEQARTRLLQHEASVLNQVMRQGRHPGIVPLLDAWLSADPPCLKYEYIEGGDLAGLVRDWPEDPAEPRWPRATSIVGQLAHILSFAHRLTPPIVHRDLKPANVLVQRGPTGDLGLWVTDFGIGGAAARQALAEVRGASVTQADQLGIALRGAHTPLYAGPQQVRGEPPDPRDDVHALGVIWYQLLTGDLASGQPTGLWTEDLAEQGMPTELIRLLGACVSARAERRPADAGVLAEQLERLTVPTPMVAKPVPPPVHQTSRTLDRLEEFLQTGRTGALSWLLDLTNRRIGDAGAIALANAPRMATLSVLILSGCEIGDEGIAALAASPHLVNLTRLDLWDNRLSDEGVKALAACRYLENLTTLDLGRNRIGDAGIIALASAPQFRHLTELLLVSNHIGDEGALAIAASPHLAHLAWLKPLDNRISARGADALKQAFGKRVRIM